MTGGPTGTALAAPGRRTATADELREPTTRALELSAVLALALPTPSEAPLTTVRQRLEELSAQLVALGGQPLPPSAGLSWVAPAPGGELMGAPADPAALAAGRSAARAYAAATAAAILASSPVAAAQRVRDALEQLVLAAAAAAGAGAAAPAALARALTAWAVAAQSAVTQLGQALSVGVVAGTGAAWLILAVLVLLYLSRSR